MAGNTFFVNALIEIVPLACFVLFIFFAFCDGFNLRRARKVVWAVYFLSFSYLSYFAYGYFDLVLIIPLSSVAAFALAWFQVRDNRMKAKSQ